MNIFRAASNTLQDKELQLLGQLREKRRKRREAPKSELSYGDRVSDSVASIMGSWPFIIIQSIILLCWVILNVTAYIKHWDPYPFILLNLALSFQAAYAAPIIMMSQNRQAEIDRLAARNDYDVNIKSELEIELLHQKLDLLREKEVMELISIIKGLEQQLGAVLAQHTAPDPNN